MNVIVVEIVGGEGRPIYVDDTMILIADYDDLKDIENDELMSLRESWQEILQNDCLDIAPPTRAAIEEYIKACLDIEVWRDADTPLGALAEKARIAWKTLRDATDAAWLARGHADEAEKDLQAREAWEMVWAASRDWREAKQKAVTHEP